MASFTTFTRALLPALLLGLVGCEQFEGLFSDDAPEEAATEAGAPVTPSTATPTAAAPTAKAGQGAWRTLVILDTSADRSFFAPEQALTKALEGTGIGVTRAWALGPVEIKNDAGEVIGTTDLKTVTDQAKGYVLVEDGRPPDFVAPASLPFVLQQATSYFDTPIKMNNGRAAGSGGGMGMRQGKGAKQGGPAAPAAAGQRLKMQKGENGMTGARKIGTKAGPGGAATEAAAPAAPSSDE